MRPIFKITTSDNLVLYPFHRRDPEAGGGTLHQMHELPKDLGLEKLKYSTGMGWSASTNQVVTATYRKKLAAAGITNLGQLLVWVKSQSNSQAIMDRAGNRYNILQELVKVVPEDWFADDYVIPAFIPLDDFTIKLVGVELPDDFLTPDVLKSVREKAEEMVTAGVRQLLLDALEADIKKKMTKLEKARKSAQKALADLETATTETGEAAEVSTEF